MLTDITKFNALRAEVAKYKERNKTLVFDYRDPQGNKDARSHVFKLRKMKTMVTDVHREVKAEALAACQAIDAEKRFLISEVEEMIEVHAAPIKAIEQADLIMARRFVDKLGSSDEVGMLYKLMFAEESGLRDQLEELQQSGAQVTGEGGPSFSQRRAVAGEVKTPRGREEIELSQESKGIRNSRGAV